jgi:hypothetical protein
VLGTQVAATLQAAGMHQDVADLLDQIAAACDAGDWTLELRGCLADATTLDALETCITPE